MLPCKSLFAFEYSILFTLELSIEFPAKWIAIRGVDGGKYFLLFEMDKLFWFTCLINCFVNRARLRTKVILIECCNLLTRFLSAPCCCLFTRGSKIQWKHIMNGSSKFLGREEEAPMGKRCRRKEICEDSIHARVLDYFANLAILGSNNRAWSSLLLWRSVKAKIFEWAFSFN